MKTIPILLSILVLSGCSHQNVLKSNDTRKSDHLRFQLDRIKLVQDCYEKAGTSDIRWAGCQLLHAQLQVEQGFTVTSEQSALPSTPEDLAKDALSLGAGIYLGKKTIDSLVKIPKTIDREVPLIIDREVPVFFSAPQ
jgi:hypothetical protein